MNPPRPVGRTGWRALRAMIEHKDLIAGLEILHKDLGDVFALPMPNFNAVVLVGPEANRFVMTGAVDTLCWRIEHDPLVRLLRHGFLVEDGAFHDELRATVAPAFHRTAIPKYIERMCQFTDQVSMGWDDGRPRDLLAELRRLTLLIIADTLFGQDLSNELERLWNPILRAVDYISPGLWILYPDMPRPGYGKARAQLDDFLYSIITARRKAPAGDDLLSGLVRTPGLSDALIRDQLLTLLIAGHDTSTALLTWAIYLLVKHPAAMQRVSAEVSAVLGQEPPAWQRVEQLHYLDQVIKETLRLYPPIHIANRIAARDLEFQGYTIPAGTRVLCSIYLTHRDARYWRNPDCFDPERFADEYQRTWPPFTYVPFGGGRRVCIGATFAQIEAQVVLSRLVQTFEFQVIDAPIHSRMRATLEPHPAVWARMRPRA